MEASPRSTLLGTVAQISQPCYSERGGKLAPKGI